MSRAIWKGYITLGRLGIPVRFYTATQSIWPHIVQLHDKDGAPVERVLRCSVEGKDIPYSEVIRAVEYEPGKYIPLSDRDLARATDASFKALAITQFAPVGSIEPYYFEKAFYTVPAKGGERAYALLRQVLAAKQLAAIARFVIYNREHIGALIVQDDLIMVNQLRFAEEIVPRSDIKTPPLPQPSPAEVEALGSVVELMSGPVHIHDYHNEHVEGIKALIAQKARGLSAKRREAAAPLTTPEGEIINALKSSLGDGQLNGAASPRRITGKS